MDVYLDKKAVRLIRTSAADAIEEGDTEALRNDILDAFPEDSVDQIEHALGVGDFHELLSDMLEEWSGDDVDELFELLETQLGDHGVTLKYHSADDDDDDDFDYEEEEDDEEVFDEEFEDEDP